MCLRHAMRTFTKHRAMVIMGFIIKLSWGHHRSCLVFQASKYNPILGHGPSLRLEDKKYFPSEARPILRKDLPTKKVPTHEAKPSLTWMSSGEIYIGGIQGSKRL